MKGIVVMNFNVNMMSAPNFTKKINQNSNNQNSIANKNTNSTPAFGAGYVALLPKNHGESIANDIIKPFNENLLPKLLDQVAKRAKAVMGAANPEITGVERIKDKADLADKVNFFILAGGSGSRFHQLASSVGDYNKISLPIHLQDGSAFHMLDMPLAMGKYFLGKEGYKPITETFADPNKSGTMDHIIKHYMDNPKDVKDTVVCCGDNFFGTSAEELTSFFTKAINDKDTHLALVGVERTPEEVAKRFGVLTVNANPRESEDILKLTGFEEKPELEEAKKMVAPNGNNIANTGMFYISKEAMTKIVDELKSGVNNIKKDEKELHDFAMATKYVHQQIPEWFGHKTSDDGAAVKVVKQWEDVGEPKALYRFYDDIAKKGEYVNNLPQKHAKDVQETLRNKTRLGSDPHPTILFSKTIPSLNEIPPANLLSDKIKTVRTIDGVKVIVAEK